MQRLFFTLLAFATLTTDAKLRGGSFEELKRKATKPVLRSDIRGKTLKQLGVNRQLQKENPVSHTGSGGQILKFFSVRFYSFLSLLFPVDLFRKTTKTNQSLIQIYDEFGPNVSGLGETAAMNGLIYDMAKYDNGELTEEDVIGALTGSCFVVGTNDDHFCTYEIMLDVDGTFGSVIASGSLDFKESEGGYLIVEAAGDGYSNFNGGILTLTYDSIGAETIISCELALS